MTPEMFVKPLALALFQYSYGRLTVAESEKKAKKVVPNLVSTWTSLVTKDSLGM